MAAAQPFAERGEDAGAAGRDQATGTWSLGARAGDFVFVAGMRGIDPATNTLVQGDEARIRQGFLNMKLIAESEGRDPARRVRIVVYVTDMFRFRPLVNKVQEELWGQGPYPPRTIVEVHRLNQDDIFEVEGTFYAPVEKVIAAVPSPLGVAGRSCATYMAETGCAAAVARPANREDIHGHRAIHRQ